MKKLFTTILLALLITYTSSAQKVGLVLSGGGAKGLYHVGIIKALEENNIPIDYVSGASMGAIVGAMYCAGYSPEEMIQFFVTDSVQTWLSGKIPDEYKYYFKRYEPTPEMVSVNINPKKTKLNAIQLPVNVVSPYRIDLAFMNMLQPASWAANQNFDSLMVPFRCVASDAFNKSSVVFSNGSVPFAVRASMTIPFVFKPLLKDSILMYDGGVYNNYPWQPLKEDFNPDIIIGGICAGNNPNPEQNDLAGQLMVLMMKDTDYSLPDSTDITIKRRFPDVSTLDYSKASYIMTQGYQDAMKEMPLIKERIKTRIPQDSIDRKRQAFKDKFKPLIFESISIEGLTNAQREYVLRQLGVDEHQLFNSEYFEEKYMRILATELFTGEFPEVELNHSTGFYKLKLKMSTKPSIKISIGGNISSTSLNQAYLGFDYIRIGRQANNYYLRGYFGSFYNSATIGGRHDMYTQFPFFLEYKYSYENINHDNANNSNYYANQNFRYLSNANNLITGTIGVPVLNNWALRTNVTLGASSYRYFQDLFTSADISDKSDFTFGSLALDLQKRQMNYTMFPTNGFNHRLRIEYIMGLEKFTPGSLQPIGSALKNKNRNWGVIQLRGERFYDINNWFNLGYTVDLTLSNHPTFENEIMNAITSPAFTPTVHSGTIFMKEFRSDSYLGAGLMPIFKFTRNEKLYLRMYAYGFIPEEFIWEDGWQKPTNKRMEKYIQGIFGGEIVYQTPIGPASFTVAKYTTGPRNWTYMFNFGYMIFGSRRY